MTEENKHTERDEPSGEPSEGPAGTTGEGQGEAHGRPRRLLRSRDDRMIAGVAGGLGGYFEVDPIVFRIGFVIASFLGGLGLLAYLALALFTPSEADGEAGEGAERPSPAERRPLWIGLLVVLVALIAFPGPLFWRFDGFAGWWWFGGIAWLLLLAGVAFGAYLLLRGRGDGERPRNRALRALAILVLAAAALGGAVALAAISAWVTATGNGVIVAVVVIALGIALVVAAFLGGARWLAVPALILALPAGAVAAADIDIDGGIGRSPHRPVSAAEIPADGYKLGVGELVVDLREVAWRRGERVDLELDLAIGHAIVSVPRSVCVEPDTHVHVGDLELHGRHSSGVDADLIESSPQRRAPRLRLDAEIGMGKLTITERDPDEVDDRRGSFRHRFGPGDDRDFEPGAQGACAR